MHFVLLKRVSGSPATQTKTNGEVVFDFSCSFRQEAAALQEETRYPIRTQLTILLCMH